MAKGWKLESLRHGLASKGMKTKTATMRRVAPTEEQTIAHQRLMIDARLYLESLEDMEKAEADLARTRQKYESAKDPKNRFALNKELLVKLEK